MQQIFIELWSIKDKWRELGMDGRAAFVDKLVPMVQSIMAEGIEIIAWGYNDKAIDRRVNYDVFGVYRVPNRAALDKLQTAIAGSGWYDYFDHANAGGAALSPPAILGDHIQLVGPPVFEEISDAPVGDRITVPVGKLNMSAVTLGAGRPIVFLHGEISHSYMWRNVMPHAGRAGRAIALDLIGMGHSDKLPDSHNGAYSFDTHYRFLSDALAQLGVTKDVIFVAQDWGCNLAFEWAMKHPGAVAGVAYCEPVTAPFEWSDWTPPMIHPMFRALRSDQGEAIAIQGNAFVEALPMGVLRVPSPTEIDTYRRPFAEPGEARRAPLDWARQVPLGGDNPEMAAKIDVHSAWMAQNELPKLLFRGVPGALVAGRRLDALRKWRNQTEVAVRGVHWLPEDDPHTMGRALLDWAAKIPKST